MTRVSKPAYAPEWTKFAKSNPNPQAAPDKMSSNLITRAIKFPLLRLLLCALCASSPLSSALNSSSSPQRPKILGISHVRIRVSDFCKAKDFYSLALGQRPYCPDDKKPIGGSVVLPSSQFLTLNVNSFYAPSSPNRSNMLEQVGFLPYDAAGVCHNVQSRQLRVT